MNDPAERNRAAVTFFEILFVLDHRRPCALDDLFLRARAACEDEASDHCGEQDDAKYATGIVRNILTEVLPYLGIYMTVPVTDDEREELESKGLVVTYSDPYEDETEYEEEADYEEDDSDNTDETNSTEEE